MAIVGCGAVAEQAHLPALRRLGSAPALLVDHDRSRLPALATRWRAPAVSAATDHLEEFDAALVAVPHQLHAEVCSELLAANKHVLVEKPLCTTAAEAQQLVEADAQSDATLSVAHNRRFLAVNGWVRRLLASGALGELRSISIEEGVIDTWDATTDAHLRRESAGGGVLLGTGVHVLDTLRWWLGDLSLVRYEDDAAGGVEANARADMLTNAATPVSLELSRVRELRNRARLEFAVGPVEVSLHQNVVIATPRLERKLRTRLAPQSFEDLFVAQWEGWFLKMEGADTSIATAREAAATIALVDGCYRDRRPLRLPWSVDRTGVLKDS